MTLASGKEAALMAVTSGLVFAVAAIGSGSVTVGLAVVAVELPLKAVFARFVQGKAGRGIAAHRAREGFVLWFTGLSGAGKSTLALSVAERLKQVDMTVEHLDGDLVRTVFPQTGFSREERNAHVRKCGFLAGILERNGVCVVASFISPYEESRAAVRGMCRRFVEIYVSTPLEECEKRDIKGLYRKARNGEITSFTGIDDPYEPPRSPEVTVNTAGLSVEQATDQIIARMRSLKLIE